MAKTLPASDDVFRSLFSLRICERATIESETGKLWVLIQGKKRQIPIEHIDDMEHRGWLTMQNIDEVKITDKGIYWLDRWGKEMTKKLIKENVDGSLRNADGGFI